MIEEGVIGEGDGAVVFEGGLDLGDGGDGGVIAGGQEMDAGVVEEFAEGGWGVGVLFEEGDEGGEVVHEGSLVDWTGWLRAAAMVCQGSVAHLMRVGRRWRPARVASSPSMGEASLGRVKRLWKDWKSRLASLGERPLSARVIMEAEAVQIGQAEAVKLMSRI